MLPAADAQDQQERLGARRPENLGPTVQALPSFPLHFNIGPPPVLVSIPALERHELRLVRMVSVESFTAIGGTGSLQPSTVLRPLSIVRRDD